ncbi:MAG: hypothetical protein ACC628_18785 [Pirellulaceae bacterium]
MTSLSFGSKENNKPSTRTQHKTLRHGSYARYAISKDGLNWEKPNLGLVEYNGSKENNILMEGRKLAYVFIDPHARPSERYKMLVVLGGTRIGTSPDGIHWNLPDKPLTKLPVAWDSQKLAYWDARINKYVVYMRLHFQNGNDLPYPFISPIESNPPVVVPRLYRPLRALGRVEMDDITKPWPDDNIQTIMTADELDPPDSDI